MVRLTLRLPDALHRLARQVAEDEGISMNQLIMLALAEKVSALKTESYLQARAARGDRAKFDAALAKVADVDPPDDRDRLRSRDVSAKRLYLANTVTCQIAPC